jgi:hypothetical protein
MRGGETSPIFMPGKDRIPCLGIEGCEPRFVIILVEKRDSLSRAGDCPNANRFHCGGEGFTRHAFNICKRGRQVGIQSWVTIRGSHPDSSHQNATRGHQTEGMATDSRLRKPISLRAPDPVGHRNREF